MTYLDELDPQTTVAMIMLLTATIAYFTYYFIWLGFHKRPLTEKEIIKLSEKRKRKALARQNKFLRGFKKGRYVKNQSLNPSGSYIKCDINTRIFPSFISSQLHGKKHEWWIMGLVKDNRVIYYWANKGIRDHVSLSINFYSILDDCKRYQCNGILDLHNHPNSNPSKYTTLVASSEDKKTSKTFASLAAERGISYLSFVCSVGEWILYQRHYSNKLPFEPENVTVDYIKKQNGISPAQNRQLHRELGIFHW